MRNYFPKKIKPARKKISFIQKICGVQRDALLFLGEEYKSYDSRHIFEVGQYCPLDSFSVIIFDLIRF